MRKIDLSALVIATAVVFSVNSLASQPVLTLTVHVNGAKANTGQAIASLFSSADNYLKAPVSRRAIPIGNAGEARIVFTALEAGTYAVSVVYDENGDGQLDTGLFGIPSEPVGFSNNVKGVFGPPSFDKTSFTLSQSETITIALGRVDE